VWERAARLAFRLNHLKVLLSAMLRYEDGLSGKLGPVGGLVICFVKSLV
jgi:hypothetical protein